MDPTDTEMLDWMERNHDIKFVRNCAGGWDFSGWECNEHYDGKCGPHSLREAVKIAMRKRP